MRAPWPRTQACSSAASLAAPTRRKGTGAPLAQLFALAVLSLATRSTSAASLPSHPGVTGAAIDVIEVAGPDGKSETVAWASLGTPRRPALYSLRFRAAAAALLVPHCNGRGRVLVDGKVVDPGTKGRLVLVLAPGEHAVVVEVTVSAYEKRIACGEKLRAGARVSETEGLGVLPTSSPTRKGRDAVVFVPYGHDVAQPSAVLVGAHPWNGSPWTYAAYRELLDEAQARDVVLLMPDGLGNSLYTADAEDEVMGAIDALGAAVRVDPQRVSIWGASMGGAGATTIGFHHPDRFASVASFFGDSKYDLTTYVRSILGNEAGARKVNAVDVVENARHVPVFLAHGEEDRTSPIAQSTMLFDAMKKRGFAVELERVPGAGHEAPLVVARLARVVARAATARAPVHPSRVSYRAVRASDRGAYGVILVRRNASSPADAYVDVERRDDGIHVLPGTSGVSAIVLAPGALGARKGEPVHDDANAKVDVRWE